MKIKEIFNKFNSADGPKGMAGEIGLQGPFGLPGLGKKILQ